MATKKTWYKRQLDWLENHKLFRWLLLIAFLMSLLGGFISFAKQMVDFYQLLTKEDTTEIRINVNVKNSSPNPVDLNSLCRFSVEESLNGSSISYSSFGDNLMLIPKGSEGSNINHLASGESRNYFVRFPDNQQSRDLIDRGAADFTLEVMPITANPAEGQIRLEKNTLKRDTLFVVIK